MLKNIFNRDQVVFISEEANWVIKVICERLSGRLQRSLKIRSSVTYSPNFLRNKILHFGSINKVIFKGKVKKVHSSNKKVLSLYHLVDNDPRIELLPAINEQIDLIHTASEMTRRELITKGMDPNKIVVIPEALDLTKFKPLPKSDRLKIKRRLGISEEKFVIGSFQKDGNGWEEGNVPKLIKGPDIFCDVLIELAKIYDIHVLLTGPSRGYVKNRLEEAGVKYTHHFLENYDDIVDYYNVLDLYLVTSRIEGGPQAVLEAMATGVPLVSTRVGLAPDLIKDGENAFLVEVEDREAILEKAKVIIENPKLAEKLAGQALKDIAPYDYEMIVKRYFDEIYSKFGL